MPPMRLIFRLMFAALLISFCSIFCFFHTFFAALSMICLPRERHARQRRDMLRAAALFMRVARH